MYRIIALLISAGVGGLAGWQVYINLDQIVERWLVTLGFAGGTLLVVTLLLYLPLFRHIADMIEDRFSTINSRFTARKTGVGLDEVPQYTYRQRRSNTAANPAICSICGGPGGPVCEKCATRMSKF
ncbi:MAG: hypothetical protein JXR76_22800 [Deltaproteobacteria bacterium]|nr:hypothetical protein [Deltaproteobacteria bacterium]